MNTIAEFKRKMIVGAKVDTVFHQKFLSRDEKGNAIYTSESLGIRKVSIVQSNSFAFETTRTDGEKVDSWCDWPKKTEVDFLEDGLTIHQIDDVLGTRKPILTYRFVD